MKALLLALVLPAAVPFVAAAPIDYTPPAASTSTPPSGAAGGNLGGTYPNPSVASLPAISGASLTSLTPGNLSNGGLPTGVTVSTANVVPGLNGVSNLVQMNSLGNLAVSTGTFSLSGAAGLSSFPYSPLAVFGNANTYLQEVIQNLSNGANASGDLILTNDLGGDTSYYLDIGVNSSKFSQTGQTAEASSSTFVSSSDSDLLLWAGTNGGLNSAASESVIFGSSNPVTANRAMVIAPATASGPGAVTVLSSMTVSAAFGVLGTTMTVATTGAITATSQVGGRFFRSASQNIPSSVETPTYFDSTSWTQGGAVLVAASSGSITVPIAGIYTVTCGWLTSGQTSIRRYGYISLNGASSGAGFDNVEPSGGEQITASDTLSITAGQTLACKSAVIGATGTLSGTQTFLSFQKIW